MLRKIYIRHRENVPENPNFYAAHDGFRQLGVEIEPFWGFGDIEGLEDLGPEVGLSGFVGDVQKALQKLGKPMPEPMDYPEELQEYLRRDMRQTTLETVRNSSSPMFVKPIEHKLFTGFLWKGERGDRLRLATHPNHTPVWVCKPVDFRAEYRCFILDGEILDVRLYKGDWKRAPHPTWVEDAVKKFTKAPRAYSIDWGVTFGGRTLLIEVNDGFALGHYGLASIPYAKMIDARWEEMTRP
jgi:hypothetical protein